MNHTESFKLKAKITRSNSNNGNTKADEIAVPLRYLLIFEVLLICH